MKKLTTIFVLGFLIMSLFSSAVLAEYPERTINVIVGYGAGGGTDNAARSLSTPAKDYIDVPLVISNKPGANGALASAYVQNQPADGYTILFAPSSLSLNIAMGTVEYDVEDWQPVMRAQSDVSIIVTRKDGQFKTIDELVNYAKDNPGEVKIGTVGSITQLFIENFAEAAGIDITTVNYDSAGSEQKDGLAGNLHAFQAEMQEIKGLLDAGEVRPLVFLKDGERVAGYPDVPTSVEKGWDATLGIWRGIFVKAGTPDHIVKKIHDMYKKAMSSDHYKEFESKNFLDLRNGYMSTEEFEEFFKKDVETMKNLKHLLD
ncbi:tripartite tricarboxylate transporter substrate binding protein [Halanaerobium sp. MA284_MarDTE_T2]|uniref:tripartite tricarboxylate transporter substrate binding protein n=1 Tax=Halanaerobium sp. MA284_MarDTE_T2 TaxID=2183913 RepID=UPI000DF17528|nr:tripartite tricarboxylate transporter substrate binding protein [Halanaerobium sp. MA284_MarDTE_T2]RCW48647.1 tripartite-type tricarboxylate transporter receptor subunit TctC [Halanaerobium sp. MA284_MarDTE_T2]